LCYCFAKILFESLVASSLLFFSLSLSKTKTTVGAIAAIAPCNRHFFIDGRVNCRIEKYFWWGERERKQKLLDDANRANKLTPTNKKETKRKIFPR
jgi:hypothetical protein